MALEHVAELQIVPEHVEALVASQPLEPLRLDAAIHARWERAALAAGAAAVMAGKTGRHRARLDDLRHGLRRDRPVPIRGRAGGSPGGAPWRRPGFSQMMRRNTGPAVRPAACCQRCSACTR
jgi:hypothetical protein